MVNRKKPTAIKNLKRKPNTIMSISSDVENQNPSCEMDQKLTLPGDEEHSGKSSEDLAQSIKQMISKPVKELIDERRAKRKEIDSGDVPNTLSEPSQRQEDRAQSSNTERKRRRRSIANPVVGEKVVILSLPDDFDAEHISDLDKVKERLGEWMIQRRQRGTKLTDTYYRHLKSSLTFRSRKEVADFIIYGSVPAISQKKIQTGSAKDDKASLKATPKELAENMVDSTNNGTDPTAEVQDQTSTTESVEANIVITEAHEERQVVIELSEVEGTDLQENCGQESETPAEATENVGNVKLDGVDDVDNFKDDIFDQLQDLNLDWKSNYGISDAYFDEHGMLNHIPILIDEENDGENQMMMKEKPKEVGTTLQGGCGQEFETLDGAAKRVADDDFADNIYGQLEDLNMSCKSNYGISDSYFDEHGLFTNTLVYHDVTDVV